MAVSNPNGIRPDWRRLMHKHLGGFRGARPPEKNIFISSGCSFLRLVSTQAAAAAACLPACRWMRAVTQSMRAFCRCSDSVSQVEQNKTSYWWNRTFVKKARASDHFARPAEGNQTECTRGPGGGGEVYIKFFFLMCTAWKLYSRSIAGKQYFLI